MVNRWLALRMQLSGVAFLALVLVFFCAFSKSVDKTLAGLAVLYALKLTDVLNSLNREMANLQTQLVAVERVRQYDGVYRLEEVIPKKNIIDSDDSTAKVEAAGQRELVNVVKTTNAGILAKSNCVVPIEHWNGNDACLNLHGDDSTLSQNKSAAIRINNLSLSYAPNKPLVLQNVSFEIKPGQWLGVKGRTGSGKSSLFLALLGLIDAECVCEESEISIFGANIKDFRDKYAGRMSDFRRKYFYSVPQDPAVFKGSLRFNLDVCDNNFDSNKDFNDLKKLISLHLAGGLLERLVSRYFTSSSTSDVPNSENRRNIELCAEKLFKLLDFEITADQFSHGERQLLAIARAFNALDLNFENVKKLLENGKSDASECESGINKLMISYFEKTSFAENLTEKNSTIDFPTNTPLILLLDEATSALDGTLDALIQKNLRCVLDRDKVTVVTIAHRVETIEDYDCILELENGRVVDFRTYDSTVAK